MKKILSLINRFTQHIKSLSKVLGSYILNILSAVRKIKIQARLTGSFFILSLIPLLITGLFSYYMSSNAIKSKISTSTEEVMNQLGKNLKEQFNKINDELLDAFYNTEIQTGLYNYGNMSEPDKFRFVNTVKSEFMERFSLENNIRSVVLITNDGTAITYGTVLDLENDFYTGLLEKVSALNGETVLDITSDTNDKYRTDIVGADINLNRIIIGKMIRFTKGFLPIGRIIMVFDESQFSHAYNDVRLGTGSRVFIVNSRGVIVSSRNREEIGRTFEGEPLISQFIENGSGAFINNGDLVAYSPIEYTDWFIVSVISGSYLNSESNKTGIYTLIVGIICFFSAVLLSLLISHSIIYPLNKLIISMNSAKKGDLTLSVSDNSRDEIAEVSRNFNDMLFKISALLEDIKCKERQKRTAELNALQAQINPHFLSNTLNTVKWLANIQNADNIENLITSLIDLLHASIGKGGELIPLKEEIGHIKNYILIQSYKYNDKFKVHFDIKEEVLELKILKFIIQPLIENSIIHGIEPMQGRGIITVKAYIMGACLKIEITDNGIGIRKDVLEGLLLPAGKHLYESRFNGIGVANVEERIKLFFGRQYGIHIESVPCMYTKTELTLPVMKGGRGDYDIECSDSG